MPDEPLPQIEPEASRPRTRWLGDYVSSGIRTFPTQLHTQYKQLRTRRQVCIALWCLFPLPFPFIGVVISPWFRTAPGVPADILVGLVATLSAIGLTILMIRDAMKVLRKYDFILAATEVERFVVAPHLLESAAAHNVLGLHLDVHPAYFDVTLGNTYAVGYGAKATKNPAQVTITEMTDVLPETRPAPTNRRSFRPLLPIEAEELRVAIPVITSWPKYFIFVLLLYPIAHLISGLLPQGGWHLVPLVLFGAILTMSVVHAIRCERATSSLRIRLFHDLHRGMVEILLNQDLRTELLSRGTPQDEMPSVLPDWIEQLPESKVEWTLDGIPAPWRRALPRSRTEVQGNLMTSL